MNRRIPLAPSEGWVTVALVAILCVTVTWAIDDVRLVLGQGGLTDFLMPMALAGMLVGFVGPKVGWGRWTTYLVGALFAALIVPLVTGSLLRDDAGLPYSMGEWYHASATSAASAVIDLAVKNLPYTTQYGHYLVVLGLIVWATSMFASYAVFGHHHPLNAIVALGIVLLVTMSVSLDPQLSYVVAFSVAALLLLIRSHVLEEQGEWIRRRIGDRASTCAAGPSSSSGRSWARSSSPGRRRRRRCRAPGRGSAHLSSSSGARGRSTCRPAATRSRSGPTSTRRARASVASGTPRRPRR